MAKAAESIKALVFDIDGTLTSEISWLALTRELGASVEAHIELYQNYKAGRDSYEDSRDGLLKLWQATGHANKPFFEQMFQSMALDPSAPEIVNSLQSRYQVCLITGSMDVCAQIVANRLGVDEWYANTTLEWSDTGDLVGMDYRLDQAEKKLEQFGEFCVRHGLAPTDCAVVGDGENDRLLFEASGRGILLAPQTVGQSGAVDLLIKSAAWQEITRLDELPDLLS